jgi:hypothetical protein
VAPFTPGAEVRAVAPAIHSGKSAAMTVRNVHRQPARYDPRAEVPARKVAESSSAGLSITVVSRPFFMRDSNLRARVENRLRVRHS